MSFPIERIRGDFPALSRKINDHPLVYLDSAASALKPRQVVEAIEKHYLFGASNVHRGAHRLSDEATNDFEASRRKVAEFLGASNPNEIVFTKGTTEGLNLVAHGLARSFLRPGDEILLTEMEHHSNIVPWQLVAKEHDLVVKFAPVLDTGELDLDQFGDMLTSRTKVVSIVHCSNTLGTINPIQEISQMTKANDALLVVDGAQSVTSFPVNMSELGCDFYVFGAHKLFGPNGVGALWGKEDLLNEMPPYQGGGSMIDQVTISGTTFLQAPHRFEAGTPHVAGVIGLGASVDYITEIGLNNIYRYEQDLLRLGTGLLEEIPGLRLIGTSAKKTNILSFVIDGTHPADVGQLLDEQGVAVRCGHHCTQPLMDRFKIPGTVRASLSIYSSASDLEKLAEALRKAKEILL